MPRVFFLLFALIVVFHVLRWFFTVALPEIFRVIGLLWDWLVEVIAGLYSWSVTSWNSLKGWIAARSGSALEEGDGVDQSLLDSSAASGINKEADISQTQKPMWPFGSKDTQPAATPALRPSPIPICVPTIPQVSGASNPHHELTKTKADLFRAQNQLKSLEDTIKSLEATIQYLERDTFTLTDILRHKEHESAELSAIRRDLEQRLDTAHLELSLLSKRYEDASNELEKLKPFAAVKADQRRATYSVSPELHKKWQSILRDTSRLQVLELLGQPSEILAVSLAGAAPIQLIRKGVPAPRPELMQHVTNLVQGDTLLKDWVRGVGRTAWVYADDTLAPGVIFFASESDGGQIFRIFPPGC
jgi:hypothetical protein